MLIKSLEAELLKEHFKLSKSSEHQNWSTNDCHSNQIIRVSGQDVYSYHAERSVGIGGRKDYYPDFYMTVLSFSNAYEADQHF